MKRQTFTSRNLMSRGILAILVLSLFLLLGSVQGVPAQTSRVVSSAFHQQAPQGPTDPKELEVFLDGVLAAQLKAHHIPGATVAVVKDGELFFAKGYGYADLENHKPVVADQTLFRPGSVSKLLTWTAVMQLIEEGKLDLNAGVNTYLKDFQIPATYTEPITLVHLLTHTPGFEDQILGLFVRSAADMAPLGEYLANYMPARVRPPGELAAYSNYGSALAGYIVEQVSGMPFEQYIKENILKPLDMGHSTFRQPLPPDLTAHMAVGYTYEDGAYKAGEFEWIPLAPAGALSATAVDMAKFMIAHLQNGRYGGARILQEVTAQEMHRRHFTHDPRVSGWTYGFAEMHANNQRIIWHGGATFLFLTALVLLPEQDVGLFVSYNSRGGAEAPMDLLKAFLNRYYPVSKSPAPQPAADFRQRAGRFTGGYRPARSNQTTLEKAMTLFLSVMVTATGDGALKTAGLLGPEPTQWVEVEPLVFRNPVSQEILVFREDDRGHITHMFYENNPYTAYIKLPWHRIAPFHFGLLGSCVFLFLSAVLAWPIGFLINRRKRETRPFLPRLARWLAGSLSVLNLLFLIGFTILMSDLNNLIYGVHPTMKALMVIPLLTTALAVGLVLFTVLAWKNRYWGVVGHVYYTLVTLAALAFVWFLNYWNLLGFRF